ncbi:hypothetical protein [Mucilaginibacter ginkgonis]|uniref:Uncharacterized protein n=1 Tax=Mucilaginibacter ginkgonis TaxID=2682091 RepID=A0A6I4HYL4_9SPHI|nr:hypothetical protein [Mucilaginibacter ginkgonis]QQL51439.1 hypothetical protein GO620_008350 [Mucilaginibacter ginkgonis]
MKRLFFICLGLLVLSACTTNIDSGALRNFVKDKLKDKEKGTFNLADYKEGDWDKVYVLGPYTNDRVFDATLKAYKKDIQATGVDTETDICLVMLFKGDKMVTQSVFDRKKIDFNNLVKFTTNTLAMPYKKGATMFGFARKSKYEPYVITAK